MDKINQLIKDEDFYAYNIFPVDDDAEDDEIKVFEVKQMKEYLELERCIKSHFNKLFFIDG